MKLNKNIAVSENGFIFNPLSGDSFSTNPVGQEVIRLLKDGKSRSEIITDLASRYAAEPSVIEKDLGDFFQMLQSFQLLTGHEQA